MTQTQNINDPGVRLYGPEDERPHERDLTDPHWQESIFFWWWDDNAGIGAIHRIGHEPNTIPPTANSWNGVFTRDGRRFRRSETRELTSADRLPHGRVAGPSRYTSDDSWRFEFSDPDCELRLEWCDEITPLAHVYPATMPGVHNDYAPEHYETSGRVRGTARIGDRTIDVDALAYRDHSWGRRDWPTLLAHRYLGGTVGPELTFCSLTWLGTDGTLTSFGVVNRNGTFEQAESVDFLTYMEPDGTTHRGGKVTFHMPGGEDISIQLTLVDAVLHEHGGESGHAISAVDSICIMQYQGITGMANLEISNNPRNGSNRVPAANRAIAEDGLSQRDWSFV
jgi:hypothetical protein